MKAICIIGSPRQNGSTARLVEHIAQGMESAGAQVRCYALGDLCLHFCTGCRECEVTRRCVQRDDMDRILAGILESDVVLLASPSYWGDVTGQTKVFIDRSLPLCNAATGQTPVPQGKLGVAVAVRAGRSKGENLHIVDTFEHYFGHLGIQMAARLTVEGVGGPSDLEARQDDLQKAYLLGKNLVDQVQALRSTPVRGPGGPATHSQHSNPSQATSPGADEGGMGP